MKMNPLSLALTSSNISITKEIIKWTVPSILISITISTKSDMVENHRNSVKVEYSNVAILLSLNIDFFFLFNLHVVCL